MNRQERRISKKSRSKSYQARVASRRFIHSLSSLFFIFYSLLFVLPPSHLPSPLPSTTHFSILELVGLQQLLPGVRARNPSLSFRDSSGVGPGGWGSECFGFSSVVLYIACLTSHPLSNPIPLAQSSNPRKAKVKKPQSLSSEPSPAQPSVAAGLQGPGADIHHLQMRSGDIRREKCSPLVPRGISVKLPGEGGCEALI